VVPAGSIFGKVAGAVLGAFSWTVGVAGKFILVTLASLVRMLIPRSWAQVPIEVFDWIVEIPNFAGQITSPTGQSAYGFAGVNAMRSLFGWIGIACLPLSLTWAGGRAILGADGPLAAPVLRVLGLAAILVFYPYLWAQAAALVDQLTHLILSPPVVVAGIRQLMAYAVEGTALGGWQLIDLALMAAIALELLALIFVKVVIVLVAAILYAIGPLLLGVVPTEAGARIARAWAGAVLTVLAIPVAWSVVFAIGAVLIGDTSTAGVLVGGSSTIAQLLGGVIVAIAGVATLWLCLRVSREAGGLIRGQLGVLHPTIATVRPGMSRSPQDRERAAKGAQAIRSFQTQVRSAAGTAAATAAPVTGPAAAAARRGLVSAGANVAVRAGARSATTSTPGAVDPSPTSPGQATPSPKC
jgi:hypothetical protein